VSVRRCIAILAALALPAGCTVGPDYVAPDVAVPASYGADAALPTAAGGQTGGWWTGFMDPRLDHFVELALSDNLDIAAAAARLAQAEAQVRMVNSGRYPSLDGTIGGDYERRITGESTRRATAEGSAALGLAWQPDVFGRQFRALQAAQAEAMRQAALRDDLARRTVATVAGTYIELRRSAARLELIDTSLDLQLQTLDIVRQRQGAGLAAELDVSRAAAEVASTRARSGPVTLSLEAARNALAVLTGNMPHGIDITDNAVVPVYAGGPDIGTPRLLLRRRPDIAAAEANLIAATATIGIAEADLYPALSLAGDLTASISDLSPGGVVKSVIGGLSAAIGVPLFDAGGRRAQVDFSVAGAQEALYTYRQTLLTALQEVETALVAIQSATLQRDNLGEAVEASESAFAQASALYREGLASFIDILDAQRTLISNRQSLVDAESDLARAVVDLYSAIGAPVRPAAESPQDL
jgi:multidrug efflux system outer membrane protein